MINKGAKMGKKILFVASNYGLWAEELQAPWDTLKAAGHELTLSTYLGKTPLLRSPYQFDRSFRGYMGQMHPPARQFRQRDPAPDCCPGQRLH